MLVILDGMDFTGKSSHSRQLAKEYGFERLSFPNKKVMFEDVFKGLVDAYSSALLFAHDYISHVKRLTPDKNYVFDRSFISTLLYQSPAIAIEHNIPLYDAFEIVYNIYFNEKIKYHPEIDMIFLLKVSPEEYIRRLKKPSDIFEEFEFQSKLYKLTDVVYAYLRNKMPHVDIYLIDTTNKRKVEVYNEIKGIIEKQLPL